MKFLLLVVTTAVWMAMAESGGAMFVAPQPVPVERLIKSAQRYLTAHPAEAEAHYTLARIHYLAFARGAHNVPAFPAGEESGKPELPGDWQLDYDLYEARKRRAVELALRDIGERGPAPPAERVSAFEEARGRRSRQLEAQNWQPRGSLPVAEMLGHASAAIASFHAAMALDPKNGLYPLGAASLAEQFADWAGEQRSASLPPELRGLTVAFARATYLRAFRMAIGGEASLPSLPVSGFAGLVSHEAGEAFLRLVEHESAKLRASDKAATDEVRAGLKKLKKLRLGSITPIILSLRPVRLSRLLAPRARVSFDLRGFGPRELWPWVRPAAGLLVWDPEGNGRIKSARQLFGSYTFEIFRRNGYAALAALDDDGDGRLTGEELRGLRVWFDANGDGRAQPAEVHDLCDFGIAAISVRATAHEGRHPMNPHGLTLSNGDHLPTWDWIVHPAR